MTDDPRRAESRRAFREGGVRRARQAWTWTLVLARIAVYKLATGVEFIRLKRRARTLQSELRAHLLYLGQLVVRLHRQEGEGSVFSSCSEIKSEIEAVSRREAKLTKLAIEIADVRTELKRRSG